MCRETKDAIAIGTSLFEHSACLSDTRSSFEIDRILVALQRQTKAHTSLAQERFCLLDLKLVIALVDLSEKFTFADHRTEVNRHAFEASSHFGAQRRLIVRG